MPERELKRYAAYFRGWCQAFGEHEDIPVEDSGRYWLLAENQVGLVLPKPLIKPLYREVLLHEKTPALTFGRRRVEIGSLHIPLTSKRELQALDAIEHLIETRTDLHVYLTSHFLYGTGSRIITFSNRKPLPIIYKEIGTMHIRLLK